MFGGIPNLKAELSQRSPIAEHAAKSDPIGIFDQAADFAYETGGFDEVASKVADRIEAQCKDGNDMYRPVAICGEWGSGKTSFIHRVLYQMGENERAMFFDPWMSGGRESIVSQFFAQLTESLGEHSKVDLSNYARAFVMAVSRGAIGLVNASECVDDGLLDATLRGFSEFVRMRKTADDFAVTFEEEKARISEEMRCIGKRQIVVVDNIDRLPSDEVRMMFRFLGTIVRFPNVLYILLFDTDKVVRALSDWKDERKDDAELYIEKIVPLRIKLPSVDLKSIVAREFSGYPEIDDGEFIEAFCGLLGTPRCALKMAGNIEICGPLWSKPIYKDAPLVNAYIQSEMPGFYRALKTSDDARFLPSDIWGCCLEFQRNAKEAADRLRSSALVRNEDQIKEREISRESPIIQNALTEFDRNQIDRIDRTIKKFIKIVRSSGIIIDDEFRQKIENIESNPSDAERSEGFGSLGDAGKCWQALKAVHKEQASLFMQKKINHTSWGVSFPLFEDSRNGANKEVADGYDDRSGYRHS